ncbi:MAG: Gfo/Idh/MocA family oxidoreductase [Armatimonas sp.]
MSFEKVRIGVVGCGVVATAYYLPYILRQSDIELVAVCDTNSRRTAACQRLFGAKQQYTDYFAMLEKAELDAVFILTGPGTHAKFALAAAERNLHFLLQKPMALTMADTNAIVDAVRKHGVKALIEPSSSTALEPHYQRIRQLVLEGALGNPYWFTWMPGVANGPHPSLGGNPYGVGAFYAKDSGGMLLDFPYAPVQIASVLGSCKKVSGMAKISIPDRHIVPEDEYDTFLESVTDPEDANYWRVVVDLPKTQPVQMEAEDNSFSLYEMDNGCIGAFHIARAMHPMPPGVNNGGFRIFGTEGNLVLGGTGHAASLYTTRKDLRLETDENGWHHISDGRTYGRAPWPIPPPGAFNYYHESTRHLIDCIKEDRDPLMNVEWGRHINEMMLGSLLSAHEGITYEMTSTLTGLR